MHLKTLLLVGGLAAAAPCQSGIGDTSYRFRVHPPVSADTMAILRSDFDLLKCGGNVGPGPFDVIVSPSELPAFSALGVDATLLDRGQPYMVGGATFGDAGPAAPPAAAPDPRYYTTAEIEAEIDAVVAAHPNIAVKVNLSTQIPGGLTTHDGNSIYALKISDNPSVEEDEPAMVFAAQHHAREMNAPHMVVGAMNRVADAYGSVPAYTATVDSYELYFVPCCNPDGVDHIWCCDDFWRKNRRNNPGSCEGVDLNRNFGFLWTSSCDGSTSTCSSTYKGPSSASEPETKTMVALHRYLRPDVYLDFHSFGREVLALYAPCANVTSQIVNMSRFWINDLRGPMNYATRSPSASGEAPHDHWAKGGTMSLLVEIGTSFQPSFNSTIAEEARVWPGLDQVLRTWRPSVRGHVRSIFQNQPLSATITYTPDLFRLSERNMSRGKDGRYMMWLPQNTDYQITFAADGHFPLTVPLRSLPYKQTIDLDVELVPNTLTPSTINIAGTHVPGTTTSITYNSPGDSGDAYWIALSGADTPGFPIGTRTIPLAPDSLLFASTQPGFPLNNIGILPGSASATAQLPIPPNPALSGLDLFTGGVTINTNYNFDVKKFSPSDSFQIQ